MGRVGQLCSLSRWCTFSFFLCNTTWAKLFVYSAQGSFKGVVITHTPQCVKRPARSSRPGAVRLRRAGSSEPELTVAASCFFFSFCFVLFCTAGAGSVRSVLLYLLPRRLTDRRGRAVVGLQMKCWMTFLCSSNCSLLRKLRSETCRASLQQASMLCFCTPPTTSPPSSLLPSVFYCLISTFPLQCLFCPSLTTQQQHPSSGSLGRWHLQPVYMLVHSVDRLLQKIIDLTRACTTFGKPLLAVW